MKKLFLKILIFFAFILNFSIGAMAQDYGINSVIYDNSGAFLTVNSYDLEDYDLKNTKLYVIEEEHKAYFDIPNAVLKCKKQNFIIKYGDINEITVSQFSTEPNIVRIVIKYNDNFNPYNLKLKKQNNTIFLNFNNLRISNYYFQNIFSDLKQVSIFDNPGLQTKVANVNSNIFNQINNSFNKIESSDADFILTNKDYLLNSKFYMDTVNFKGAVPVITGIGSFTLSKPIYLSNPSRVAFDIQNTIINPALRNKEIVFSGADKIKFGQFDRNTARIVISSDDPAKYIPVIYPDNQRLSFWDSKNSGGVNLYSATVNLTSVKYESNDSGIASAKLTFSRPLILGVNRQENIFDIHLFNVENYALTDIKSEFQSTPYENVKISDGGIDGIKLSFETENIENVLVYVGADGKTLRIKTKLKKPYSEITNTDIRPAEIKKKKDNKHYVLIDAGHGGSDVGATRNGIFEKDITLDISKKVEKMLTKKGYIVAMTREDDVTVSLEERVEMSEAFNPDVFVSIHVNSSNSENPYGLETHYYKDNSIYLAKCVHASMLNNINSNDRGLFKSKFYVINHTTAPAILVETGFISNPTERSQIVTESRKNATAKAIVEGIDEYFKP